MEVVLVVWDVLTVAEILAAVLLAGDAMLIFTVDWVAVAAVAVLREAVIVTAPTPDVPG